ncbi:uncharacterized protein LOC129716847 [Wyeomyia smithii]|uniref:uncharacterized protein LOC129716847 n=1 Tax=Wyeomyia smithii TaxID=174621 RepID=UPI00246800DD|nr:uncharacterized protein LOC129716847 [Wyeomyia smithii]
MFNNEISKRQIGNEFSEKAINWHFIPPRAPNFGGLWEAAVRSVKNALKREIGNHQLTHGNLSTLLVQKAAALNSRPLVPLSDDPSNLNVLTPGHFLIGAPMEALPDRNLLSTPKNHLIHYQQREQMFQQYWQRWSNEYLSELQATSKGIQPTPIRIGNIAVLREDNMPPLCWPLARITDVHPGSDGVIRVVTVKTANGIYKRPVCRVCPLPDDEIATQMNLSSPQKK